MFFLRQKNLIDKIVTVIIEKVVKLNSVVLETFVFTCEWSFIEWFEFDWIA